MRKNRLEERPMRSRVAVGREPHDFVFVVLVEAEIVRDERVEISEAIGRVGLPHDLEVRSVVCDVRAIARHALALRVER